MEGAGSTNGRQLVASEVEVLGEVAEADGDIAASNACPPSPECASSDGRRSAGPRARSSRIGTEIDKRTGSRIALLARDNDGDLRFAGGAFFALREAEREALPLFSPTSGKDGD